MDRIAVPMMTPGGWARPTALKSDTGQKNGQTPGAAGRFVLRSWFACQEELLDRTRFAALDGVLEDFIGLLSGID